MDQSKYRQAIADYIRHAAQPPDKYSHQPRLYQHAKRLAEGQHYDDDVLYAAAWLHDIGVFIGHRPEDPAALASWDNVRYAVEQVPQLLGQFDFPEEKIAAVVEVIRTHLPTGKPSSMEGLLLRDADILEQLGAIAILRIVSKVGRDTRYPTHGAAVRTLQRNLEELPQRLHLESAQREAKSRVRVLHEFLAAVEEESGGVAL